MKKIQFLLCICNMFLLIGCDKKPIEIQDEYKGKGIVWANGEKWEGIVYAGNGLPFTNKYEISFGRTNDNPDRRTNLTVLKLPLPVEVKKYFLCPPAYFSNDSLPIAYSSDSILTGQISLPSSLGNDVTGIPYNIMRIDSNNYVEILSYNKENQEIKVHFQFTVFRTYERQFFTEDSIKISEGIVETKVKYIK